jgi:hypothetical protein
MIEDPERDYISATVLYNCHLMSKKDYPEEEKNPNNILRLSWSLHQRFDGLNTSEKHLVPQIAIGFVRFERQEEMPISVGYAEWKDRVTIFIEARDLRILTKVGNMLKSGSQSSPDKEGKIYTFVHVDSHEDFRRCLTTKYEETKRLWSKYGEGQEIPVEEEEVSRRRRRSSRIAAAQKSSSAI